MNKKEKEEEEKKILSPTIDVVFQALFGEVGNEKITKAFLESILNKKLESVNLDKNPILRRKTVKDKLGILDIVAELNGKEICDIEMQMVNKDNIIARFLLYWSKLYSKGIQIAEDYTKLKRTIGIFIVNDEVKELKTELAHTKWMIIEEKNRTLILTDLFEMHIIQLPKKGNLGEEETELSKWLEFLKDPESERVIEMMKEDEELQEAGEKLKIISKDEELQRLAELREKAIMDEKAIYSLGIKEGKEQGRAEGKIEGIQETARKMLEEKIEISTIMKITGMTKEELENL